MKRDNHVGAGGIAIAIVFGSSMLAVIVGLVVMNSKANRAAKKKEEEQQALLSGYSGKAKRRHTDVEGGAYGPQVGSEANLPLIREPGAGYGGQDFVDNGRRAPQLHQGLGALR